MSEETVCVDGAKTMVDTVASGVEYVVLSSSPVEEVIDSAGLEVDTGLPSS